MERIVRRGLVLTGGGARGAYQAGVLRGIAEIVPPGELPFDVVTGLSAGAINAAFIACRADDFQGATARLWDVWANLAPQQIFRTDTVSLGRIGAHLLARLSLGGAWWGERVNYLLDTSPLAELLDRVVDPERLQDHLDVGRLYGLALTATNYQTGTAITFFQGAPETAEWTRTARMGKRTRLRSVHALASSAIPAFFPPVDIDGVWYGDGCIRMTAPLSPAIHLGAERLVAIGIRHMRAPELVRELDAQPCAGRPDLVDVAGIVLNAVFMDSLDADVERLERINRTLGLIPAEAHGGLPPVLRRIPLVAVRPSQDLGKVARDLFDDFPLSIRHLLRGLGASPDKGADLMSYLAFDADYTVPLLELGRADALARADELRAVLAPEAGEVPTGTASPALRP